MSNNCNSKCWWRCGIPSLEHIDPSVQQQLFSKPFWFLEQDCDSECYCTTDDNLNEDCEIGQIKYGNCLDYTQWNTTSYHEPCKDLSPPQTECGDGCCDTYNGSKICCNNQCVLSDKCCGNKVLGLDEECCDDKIVKKCRRFETGNSENNTILNNKPCTGGDPCGDKKCGCDDGQTCCEDKEGIKECVDKEMCCGGQLVPEGRICCGGKICGANNNDDYECINDKCCRFDKVAAGGTVCCEGGKKPCGGRCCSPNKCFNETCLDCDVSRSYVLPPACGGARVCLKKAHTVCGCYQCSPNETCHKLATPGGGLCCPKGQIPGSDGDNRVWTCCSPMRAAPAIGETPPKCCPIGTRGCSDGKCRQRCQECGAAKGPGITVESCETNERCCAGASCYNPKEQKCCFGRSGLSHICPIGKFCCGGGACCGAGEVCCGPGNDISGLKCLDVTEFKCCVPFGPCPINTTCCGPNCCTRTQRCINGQCFGPGDNPVIPPNA